MPLTRPYFADGRVTLYLGDCREATEWLAADVLITDPPYGINYSTGYGGQFTGSKIAGDADETLRDTVLAVWGDRPAVVFASFKQRPYGRPHPMPLIFDKGEDIGMGDLSWPWRPSYELAWVYGRGWAGKRRGAVLRYRVLPGNFTHRDHPTQKPVALFEDIITKAPPGIIADPFAGSGSILIAARNLGRSAIGVELDERYAELAAKRLCQGVLEFPAQEPAGRGSGGLGARDE
jgi:site-specific DNA-methyltransferase (adenine-specific)